MSIIQALLLGIVQGITEFLPISSSGHLVVLPKIFGWEEQSLAFDTTLHLGTALALIVCFWKDIILILKSLFRDIVKSKKTIKDFSPDSILGIKVLLGSVPVGLIGLIFSDIFENVFRGLLSVAIFLIFGSIIMYIAELKYKKRLIVKDDISLGKSFMVGLFQILALFPGVSRSGATISGGMLFGLSRKESTRFSFLLSIPIVLAAGIYKLFTSFYFTNIMDIIIVVVGFTSSFIVGVLAIKFMLKFVRNNKLYPFIIYRLGLALFLIILNLI